MSLEIRAASMDDVRVVRHLVLRPHQPVDELTFEHDLDADASHLGAYDDGAVVGVASITREPPPGDDDVRAWRVRGMAVVPSHRDRGIGGELLERCVGHAREHGASFVWLNARLPARRFYERHAFVAHGQVFDVPSVGPHVEFRRSLDYRARTDDGGGAR